MCAPHKTCNGESQQEQETQRVSDTLLEPTHVHTCRGYFVVARRRRPIRIAAAMRFKNGTTVSSPHDHHGCIHASCRPPACHSLFSQGDFGFSKPKSDVHPAAVFAAVS